MTLQTHKLEAMSTETLKNVHPQCYPIGFIEILNLIEKIKNQAIYSSS